MLWAPCSIPGCSPGSGSRGTWDRSFQHRPVATREGSSLQCFDPAVAGEGSREQEGLSCSPDPAQVQCPAHGNCHSDANV